VGRGGPTSLATARERSGWHFNAIAQHLDYGTRSMSRTSQMQRSFEDTGLKQRALELVRLSETEPSGSLPRLQ